MDIEELYDMKVKDLLETYCLVYSPECDYNYGIAKWYDVGKIFEEYDLEDHYCFDGDYLIPMDYMFESGEEVLELKDLRCIMDKLGIIKKQPCPKCGSEDYHFDYNKMGILCNECGFLAKEGVDDD